MFGEDSQRESTFTVRCARCRSQSWSASRSELQGRSPFIGKLHVYADDPLAGIPRRSLLIDGWTHVDDGFYASFEEFFKADGYQHKHDVAGAKRDGSAAPGRTKALTFLLPPQYELRLVGRPIGEKLRVKCRHGHRIDVPRADLIELVTRAKAGDTIYV